jgi:hypothetical protein
MAGPKEGEEAIPPVAARDLPQNLRGMAFGGRACCSYTAGNKGTYRFGHCNKIGAVHRFGHRNKSRGPMEPETATRNCNRQKQRTD